MKSSYKSILVIRKIKFTNEFVNTKVISLVLFMKVMNLIHGNIMNKINSTIPTELKELMNINVQKE